MGYYSELDYEQRCRADAFEDDAPASVGGPQEAPPPEPPKKTDTVLTGAADDTAKRQAHEAAEAQRRAEWEAQQEKKRAAEQEQLARLSGMSDAEIMAASAQRISADTEKLTRRNMKECVSDHIRAMCQAAPAFARRAMHPRKSMVHCIWYINRKAREFIEKEMKANDIKPENGIYGSDVPDDLCYQWAVDYFNDPEAKEDQETDEQFVPRPYYGGSSKTKKAEKPPKPTKSELKQKAQEDFGQLSLLGEAG